MQFTFVVLDIRQQAREPDPERSIFRRALGSRPQVRRGFTVAVEVHQRPGEARMDGGIPAGQFQAPPKGVDLALHVAEFAKRAHQRTPAPLLPGIRLRDRQQMRHG